MKQETANKILSISAVLSILIMSATAAFIGYQASLMREQAEYMHTSLKGPFQANLQDHIMNVCAEFAYHADYAKSRVTFWGSVKRNDPEVGHANLDERLIYSEAITALSDFRPKIEQVEFYAEGESLEKLNNLESRITDFQLYLLKETGGKEHEDNIVEWWDERVGFVKDRCREVLVGELQGLL